MKKLKCIIYLNQFFSQIGGEDKADIEPIIKEGALGPGLFYQSQLGENIEVTHTIICGDNYMGSNTEKAIEKIMALLKGIDFDMFFAGPAFRAGRYGVACGLVSKAIKEKYNIPVYSSMNDENPGVEMFKKDMIIFKGGASAASMKSDIKIMVDYAKRVANNEEVYWADKENYFGRGIRHQVFVENAVPAADRAFNMLLAKLNKEKYTTELPVEIPEKVQPAEPILNLSQAKIALLNTGGIVPIDNPDRIQSASATRWGKYDISNMRFLDSKEFKTIHAGFDPTEANKNPNVVAPIDVLKDIEREKIIGKLHNYFYTTVGTGTTQSEATRMAKEITSELIAANVHGVIMVST